MRAVIAALSFSILTFTLTIIFFGSEVRIVYADNAVIDLQIPPFILNEPSWGELKIFSERVKKSLKLNDKIRTDAERYFSKAPLSPKAFYVRGVITQQADFEKFLPLVRLDLEGELLLADLAKNLGKTQLTQEIFGQYLRTSNGRWVNKNKEFLKILSSAPDIAPLCPEDPEIWTKELVDSFSKDGEEKALDLQMACITEWRLLDPMIAHKDYRLVASKLFPHLLPKAHQTFNQLLYTWALSTGLPNAEYWKMRSNFQPINLNFGMRSGDPLPELGSLSRWGLKGIKVQSQSDLVIGAYVPENVQVSIIEFGQSGILQNAKVYISPDNLNWSLYSSWKREVAAPILGIDREALYFQSPLREKYVKILIANSYIKDQWVSFDALG